MSNPELTFVDVPVKQFQLPVSIEGLYNLSADLYKKLQIANAVIVFTFEGLDG